MSEESWVEAAWTSLLMCTPLCSPVEVWIVSWTGSATFPSW